MAAKSRLERIELRNDDVLIEALFSGEESRALGADLRTLIEQADTMIRIVVALRQMSAGRRGNLDNSDAYRAVVELMSLRKRVNGVFDAVIRNWPGSHDELASALSVSSAEARNRMSEVVRRPASLDEMWALLSPLEY